MAERELAIVLRARDLASKTVRGLKKELGTLGKTGQRAFNGMTTAITRLGAAAAVGLVGAIGLGVRSLGHLERVTNQTNAVIESTGGVAQVSAEQIRKHAQALEALTTADDKAIQEGQNLLLTFTGIGKETFPDATEAAVNMAIAMAKGDVAAADFKGTAIQVGKALNDPTKGMTALSRAGVSFTKEQKDQVKALQKSGDLLGAQKIILGELEREFGKAGKAAGTGFEADLRRVQDAGEDASMALAKGVMPALARVAAWLQKKLSDPTVIKALEDLGKGLGDAAMGVLDFVEGLDFKAIGSGLKIAADAAKGIVSAFMSMPDWVKTAVISGWGLNKLTGGAVGGIIGELGKGLIKGVLGMNAGVVNINAAVVNGGGGLPGGPALPGAVAAAGMGTAAALTIGGVAVAAAIVGAVNSPLWVKNTTLSTELEGKGLTQAERAAVVYYSASAADQAAMRKRLAILPTQADYVAAMAKLETLAQPKGSHLANNDPDSRQWRRDNPKRLGEIKAQVKTAAAEAHRIGERTNDGLSRTRDAALETKRETGRGAVLNASTTRSASAQNASTISSAIARNRAQVSTSVVVNVTAGSVTKTVTTNQRYGGNTASRSTDKNAAQPA